jgi:hypothetical protein
MLASLEGAQRTPTRVLFDRLPRAVVDEFEADVVAMWTKRNGSREGRLTVPVEHLQAIAIRS